MNTFTTSREVAASCDAVFAAFQDPERLARWWGPAGFSNTFSLCEFVPGGRWVYVMHGPDGKDYPNEAQFTVIEPERRVVIQHVSAPRFQLAITFIECPTGTWVGWEQAFEDAAVAAALQHIVEPANEQNLDRLSAEVLAPRPAI